VTKLTSCVGREGFQIVGIRRDHASAGFNGSDDERIHCGAASHKPAEKRGTTGEGFGMVGAMPQVLRNLFSPASRPAWPWRHSTRTRKGHVVSGDDHRILQDQVPVVEQHFDGGRAAVAKRVARPTYLLTCGRIRKQSCPVATSEPVVLHHGRQARRCDHDEARPSASLISHPQDEGARRMIGRTLRGLWLAMAAPSTLVMRRHGTRRRAEPLRHDHRRRES
jgi:hypothetical protein